ncbi:MAG TPA: D-2-hydroxyacid dehydrogenase [Terriglobales bacterium]|nr:D-2-hydroxyacid dehydrogenase [Terriglobales bacterium]
MKLLIAVHHRFALWNAPAWVPGKLRQEFPQLDVVQLPSYDDIETHIRDAEILIAWSVRPEQIKHARNLRWIHSPAAAVHQLVYPEIVERDIVLTNAREINGPVVAEHVLAQIFALAKKLPQAVRLQQKHVWGQELLWNELPRVREVAGATLGLVGLGSIGREVARRAAALGMRVIALREHAEKGSSEGVETVLPTTQLDQLLTQSDYVVLATPVTPSTTGLVNAARLARMKPDACLINVGRGPLIDEAALADALRSHRLGGAALDVFPKEPLPGDSPLWDLENLLITPHTAALTDKLWSRHYDLIRENLRRYLAHEPLLAMVDKDKGY